MPIDAPTFKALFELADKHGGFVQIHMEDDGDSIDGLERLLKQHPGVPVVLSHHGIVPDAKNRITTRFVLPRVAHNIVVRPLHE